MKKIVNDLLGLIRICGPVLALIWLCRILTHLPEIVRRRNLQPADNAMGEGPFLVKYPHCNKFRVSGVGAISGIREMYVRDTYLHGGILSINDGDTVVDLGANMGNFTNLALAHGDQVRVIAVEPSSQMNARFNESVGLNSNHLQRCTLIRGFLGDPGEKQRSLMERDQHYMNAPWISEQEVIDIGKLTSVDFLKCDIEGGEFELLNKTSKLLAMTRSLAIEIHAFAGDVSQLIEILKVCGFTICTENWERDGSCTVLAKRL